MLIQRQLLVPVMAAGLLSAALSACSGAGTQAGSPATSRPTTVAKPVTPTTMVQMQGHLYSVLNGAKSAHVKGVYTWAHAKLTVDVGMLRSGQMEGFINNEGLPMPMIDVGGKMYVKTTPGLAAFYHQASCAPVCGKYAIYPPRSAAGMVRSMGWKWTWNMLTQMADYVSKPVHTTFHGQPALQAKASGYDRGAYIIVTATPQTVPLEAVDPGHFKLTFSNWNSVPVPAAPPKSKMAVK